LIVPERREAVFRVSGRLFQTPFEGEIVRKVLWSMSILAVAAGMILPVVAADPVKFDKIAPASDLAMEAEAQIAALETALASNDSYLAAKKSGIPGGASVLAVVSQALAMSTDKGDFKGSAADMRDAAVKLAKAGSYDDAKAALEAVKEAAGGKASGAKADGESKKLIGLGTLMSEVNKRHGRMRKASRSLPEDTAEAARDASVLAVLAVAAADDTHEVKKPAEVGEWKKMAADMQVAFTELSASLKEKSADKVKAGFMKANATCADCHKKFRAE